MRKPKPTAFARNFKSALDHSDMSGWKHKPIGDEFGISGPMVSQYLSGKKVPGMERGVEIAVRLNVCVEWLYTGRGPRSPVETKDPRLQELEAAWPNLEDNTRDALLAFAVAHKPVHPPKPPPKKNSGATSRRSHKTN